MDLSNLGLDIQALRDGYREKLFTPVDVVTEVFRRIEARGQDYAWTELVDKEIALRETQRIEKQFQGKDFPSLYGIPFSVKDNVDIIGMRTTCGCEGFDHIPNVSATSVTKALDAGAILIGKNALDQFATGLNGTRTMGGHCRNVFDERYISGGSSSGSGVAVAAGIVTFSLGSDTGGSGRVPAAMNNIVGVKPTLGLVSGSGLIYNNRYFDCVPVFARTVEDGYQVLEVIRGYDDTDIFSREDADDISLAPILEGEFTFGIPTKEHLKFFDDVHAQNAYWRAVESMKAIGGKPIEVDFSIFIEAGKLPFDSGLLAERAVSYGELVKRHPETVHPAVTSMIQKGLSYSGTDTVRAIYKMTELRRKVKKLLRGVDVLVTPTVGRAYFCEEVKANPIDLNNNIGYYTYPVSPLDLCALAIPASMRPDGLPFGISLVALSGQDRDLRAIGGRLQKHVTLKPGLEQKFLTKGD
ncbi:amidase family protein [Noviherbaspirillum sp. Root189]|uniref:amidase family protein n=1 Tax=Noviherbaspirillum sp. Root189 TaxID=1736487 RepID=UPI000AB5AB9E|nr:amidase family protein [Noviherbaspirillum sp. Root189]